MKNCVRCGRPPQPWRDRELLTLKEKLWATGDYDELCEACFRFVYVS